MKIPQSKLYKKQNDRIIPSVHKKAVIVNSNLTGNIVDIYFVENPQSIIRGVQVAYPSQSTVSSYANTNTIMNLRCVVDIFDETNNQQMIVAYTY
jgi:hypothetical protein